MTRRRLPLRRTSSSPSSSFSSNLRNGDTRNLVPARVPGGLEMMPFLRAVLLGAFVGGLVIFLSYPYISGLLQYWQISSGQSGHLDACSTPAVEILPQEEGNSSVRYYTSFYSLGKRLPELFLPASVESWVA